MSEVPDNVSNGLSDIGSSEVHRKPAALLCRRAEAHPDAEFRIPMIRMVIGIAGMPSGEPHPAWLSSEACS